MGNNIAKDDCDEVELACRDLMLASLENMRKEIIPGKRDLVENDVVEKEYQEIADFINMKVSELEAEMPEKIKVDVDDKTIEVKEKITEEPQEVEEELPEVSDEKMNLEPIEQEFSLTPNKQMIIDQITANDIESAVSFKGKK